MAELFNMLESICFIAERRVRYHSHICLLNIKLKPETVSLALHKDLKHREISSLALSRGAGTSWKEMGEIVQHIIIVTLWFLYGLNK